MLSTQFLLKNTLAKNVSKQGLALFSLELANNYSTISKAMICEKHGKPKDVLGLKQIKVPDINEDEVLIKFLASPINPSDINQIEGVYPIKPRFKKYGAVGGNEGVAEVVAAGSKVKNLTVGDWVIPDTKAFGTWQTFATSPENQLQKLVNPPTAYRMLKDFVNLKKGDVIIQNGANSAVGQSVIQIAKAWGIKTINVIRDRPNFDELAGELHKLGATLVIKEEDLRSNSTRELVKNLGNPVRLALNCVGGKSASGITRLLGNNATIVTYGGMSKQPLTFGTGPFIFKNLRACGYWNSRWNKEASKKDKQYMYDDICELIRGGYLSEPWHEETKWEANDDDKTLDRKFKKALSKAGASFGNKKQILTFE
ncbi:NAD(P)-binding protein [Neocallimastix californiae]|uniref:NAD(P)-binding protein n=1 Tax=Neocallimastix californiae TaxID=1754190 RepID=A0A1Y2DBI0_9FUNG|nr:NAD(P)-binding protein [Neocallimastix californiae]|eukprot:ORY56504.1 NAD(P)-binding protein [Neocallimastix californiae]